MIPHKQELQITMLNQTTALQVLWKYIEVLQKSDVSNNKETIFVIKLFE